MKKSISQITMVNISDLTRGSRLMGKQNPRVQHRLGSAQLRSGSVERDLRVLVDK